MDFMVLKDHLLVAMDFSQRYGYVELVLNCTVKYASPVEDVVSMIVGLHPAWMISSKYIRKEGHKCNAIRLAPTDIGKILRLYRGKHPQLTLLSWIRVHNRNFVNTEDDDGLNPS